MDVPATPLAEMVRNKDFVWYLEVSKKRPLASRTKTRGRKLYREEAQLIFVEQSYCSDRTMTEEFSRRFANSSGNSGVGSFD